MTGLKAALQDFWSGFGVDAYLRDCVPADAVLPYITYEVVQGAGVTANVLTAIGWYETTPSGNRARTELMDAVANVIPEAGIKLPVDNGFVVLYRNDANFLADYQDEDDDTVLGARISYQINYYL